MPEDATGGADPSASVELAGAVGVAMAVVHHRLTPSERVSFILHDTLGLSFSAVAQVLATSPAAARKLASRARAKVAASAPATPPADWEVVDAFLTAAKGGDFATLVHLLAPDVVVRADAQAVATGTPARLEGRTAVAEMFDGAAHAALPVFIGARPGAAWYDRGTARVAFDFAIRDGHVHEIVFRAAPERLATIVRRRGADPR